MNENLENLKEKAASAAQSAQRTAKYLALVSRNRIAIAREQERIRRAYQKLGKVYYKDYVTDEEPDEAEYQPLCEAISDSFRLINELREEMAEAKEAYAAKGEPEAPETAEEAPEEAPEDVTIVPIEDAEEPKAE